MQTTDKRLMLYAENRQKRLIDVPKLNERKHNIEALMLRLCLEKDISMRDLRKMILDEGVMTNTRLSQYTYAEAESPYNDLTPEHRHYLETFFTHCFGQRVQIISQEESDLVGSELFY
jgi:hypothetical protein